MPSPFPGMDPYLEHHDFWPAIHHLLISQIFMFLLKIDYQNWKPIPALSEADTIWADALLRDRGLRQ